MTIGGLVIDAVTGATLPNAHVYVERERGPHGTTTNMQGEYLLSDVMPGELLRITFVGYTGETMTIPPDSGTPFVHELEPGVQLGEFEVVAAPRRSLAAFGLIAMMLAALLAND